MNICNSSCNFPKTIRCLYQILTFSSYGSLWKWLIGLILCKILGFCSLRQARHYPSHPEVLDFCRREFRTGLLHYSLSAKSSFECRVVSCAHARACPFDRGRETIEGASEIDSNTLPKCNIKCWSPQFKIFLDEGKSFSSDTRSSWIFDICMEEMCEVWRSTVHQEPLSLMIWKEYLAQRNLHSAN